MIAIRQMGDYVMEIVGDYPLTTGVITPFLTVGVSFVDGLEIGLRIGILSLGFIAAALTVIAKWRHVVKSERDNNDTT